MTDLNKREQIIVICRELVQEKGYQTLTMSEIAKKLKIKAPSIYHYFSSKEQMVKAAIISYRDTFQLILEKLEKQSETKKCLEGLINAYSLILKSNGKSICLYASLMAEVNTLPDSIIQELNDFFDLQVNWIVKIFQNNNPISKSEAIMIIATLKGSMDVARLKGDSKYFKSSAYTLLNNFIISPEKLKTPTKKGIFNGLIEKVLSIYPSSTPDLFDFVVV
ncbi:TetR/AcrR family transcriptional regulator [Crocosphaera sp. Alani8]|uniref:TetR/AcrR family transcriptional regulator n=1 Tax=Crocosphaera sp. Alani8 TaxID=3038952 RepID=UPI00313A8B21